MVKCLIAAVLIASSQSQLASVKSVVGEVKIVRAGVGPVVRATPGAVLFSGDVVQTGKKSRTVITYSDGSSVTVFESSELKIEEKEIAPSSEISKVFSFIKVSIGRIKAVIKKITRDRVVSVTSPSSVMGVRGTDFSVIVAADGSTVVEVEEGRVALNGAEMEVEGGKRAIVDIEEGIRVQSLAIPFDYERWALQKKLAFEKKQQELLRAINRVMQQRLKKYQSFVEDMGEEDRPEKVGEDLVNSVELQEMLSHSFQVYRKRGVTLEEVENRFREVNARFERVMRRVEKRFQKKKKAIEEKLRRKQERIEERFRRFEEELK